MSHEKHITRGASVIAAGTTVSRILGYLRDMMVAHLFGAGLAADAFYAAYRIPNLLRRLLGEGSLSASFIPVLSQYVHTKSKEETQELINVVFTTLAVALTILTVLGIIFARPLVSVIAYGFANDPEKLQLTVDLTRLMFPFLLFICLAALTQGILNTMGAFFMPAVAPASLSIAEMGYILALAPLFSPDNQIRGLAISVIVGGLGQFIAQNPGIRQMGWTLRWRWNLSHPGLRRIGTLMIPSMIGLSVDQINAFVNTICASFLEQGSVTALYYSNRVMQLPLAIFGLALSSAALPAMSKAVAVNDMDAVKNSLNYSIRLIIFILVPAATGLMVLGMPIISVLFERGNFDHHAALMTNSAMFFYSLGLPAYAVTKVAAGAFYAMQDTKTPVKRAAEAMIINVVLMLLLMRAMGVGGLALATAVASYYNGAALLIILRRKVGPIGIRQIVRTTMMTMIASAVMGAGCYLITCVWLRGAPLIGMPMGLIAGVVIFFVIATLMNIEERQPILSLFRFKPGFCVRRVGQDKRG